MAQTAETSVFLDFFGQYPRSKVLDFLLENRIFDYSRREIAEHSGAGITSLNIFWDRLVSHGIVVETRRVGKAPMYALNVDSPLVKQLIELDLELTFGDGSRGGPNRKEVALAPA